MPDANVLARAIIEIGTTGISDATQQLQKLESKLADSGKAYAGGVIDIDQYLAEVARLHREIDSLRAGIETADDAMKRHGSSAAALAALQNQAATGTRNYQQSALAASYALQDFASSNGGLVQQLASVNNNIPQIVAGLGGPAGMVAGIGAFTTVVIAAAPPIYNYAKSLGVLGEELDKTGDRLENIQEKIKDLEAKPLKVPVDRAELDRLRNDLKEIQDSRQAYERFKNTKSEQERRAGTETEQLLAMAPGGANALADRLARSMGKELIETDLNLQNFRHTIAEQTKKAEEFEAAAKVSMSAGRGGMGAAAQQMKDARRARAAAQAASDQAVNREREIRGDAITGKLGIQHEKVGELFKGATGGNDEGARKRLVAQLKKIGETQLANEIAATNAHAVAVAEAEEQQEKNDERMRETNNDIRDIRGKQKKLVEAEKKVALDQASGLDKANKADYDAWKKAHDASQKLQTESARRQVGQQVDAEDASIAASGIDKMAGQLMAMLQAQGGAVDRNGRLHKMSEPQMIDFVKNEVAKYLHRTMGQDAQGRRVRANPGMGAQQTEDIATKVATSAAVDIDKRLMGLSGSNISNTSKLIMIGNQLVGEYERQQGQIQQHGQAIGFLGRRLETRQRTSRKHG